MSGVMGEWHGSEEEKADLLKATARDCSCERAEDGTRTKTCGAHAMLLEQRVLDHLVYARRMAVTLADEEFRKQKPFKRRGTA